MADDLLNTLLTRILREDSHNPQNPNNTTMEVAGGDYVDVPRPPLFQAQPEVIGGTDVARAAAKWLKFAPELAGRVKQIQVGPTPAMMDLYDKVNNVQSLRNDLPKHGIQPEHYSKLAILGLTSKDQDGMHNIYLNPTLGSPWLDKQGYDLDSTLLHELMHAAGKDHDVINPLIERYNKAKK